MQLGIIYGRIHYDIIILLCLSGDFNIMYKPKGWTSKSAVVGGEVFHATITTGTRHY